MSAEGNTNPFADEDWGAVPLGGKRTVPPQGDGTLSLGLAMLAGAAAVFFIPFGVFLASEGWDKYEVSRWPTTEGTIVGGSATEWSNRRDRNDRTTELNLRYTYFVDGQFYSGWRYAHEQASIPDLKLEDAVSRFRAGTKHPIRYNPDKPSESYFESNYTEIKLAGPVVMALMGVAAVPFGFVQYRKSQRLARQAAANAKKQKKGRSL